jgi:hypothetical protein
MVAKLFMERRGAKRVGEQGLFPMDPYSDERMHGYGQGALLSAAITETTRRDRLNAKYWAGLADLYNNLDGVTTRRALHEMILADLGYVERWNMETGEAEVVSIAKGNMTDEDFDDLFERVQQYALDKWGWNPWDKKGAE